ncbi:uncharacterized protein HMPREF1541_04157 [Cyphellophora europaea CBS 101466]|uniref:Major facilitator superfamily (MFS) profile domain-containing protein n=1 Tax=Cyphellophora europaea (strain CBS 101466) TaxID=1220924 RepID=W2S0F2_CYPE1|nr:uncharacterized protein HMPREF1541_04157 [Cyphellophora europaea CBS 101466]ETN42216.1 hypothetical protein HMPREF1541_04157 [Cyphellophora europaea CBS 101466]
MAINDERTPLLLDADEHVVHPEEARKDDNPNVVDFGPAPDPDNPQDWPKPYKWALVTVLVMNAFAVTFTCVGVTPVASRIIRDLNPTHRNDKSAAVLLVTIWELGEAAGPLFIGPLSEIYGRLLVVNFANLLFVAATILAALCQSVPLLIAMRALTGFAVAANVINPAIIGDIFVSEERGAAMSLIIFAPLLGGAIGPSIAALVTEHFGWRWMFWTYALLMGACELVFALFFRETYKVVILRRKAARLRTETGNPLLRDPFAPDPAATLTDNGNGNDNSKIATTRKSLLRTILHGMLRPFPIFLTSPVLILAALYGSTTFTFFYIMSTTLPDILLRYYGLTPSQIGLAFTTFSAGSLLAVLLCNRTLDRIYVWLRDRDYPPIFRTEEDATATDASSSSGGTGKKRTGHPEHRLPLVLVGAVTLPITILLYGYLPAHGPAAAPLWLTLLNVSIMGFCLLLGFLPILSYVVDATGVYSASALTAVIVVRCLFGTFLPLAVEPLVRRVGLAQGFALLAGVCWVLGVVPWVLFWRGRDWRRGSRITSGE